jgi:hypothetical protein
MTHSVPYSQQSNAGEYEKQQKKVLIIDCDYIQRRVLFFFVAPIDPFVLWWTNNNNNNKRKNDNKKESQSHSHDTQLERETWDY